MVQTLNQNQPLSNVTVHGAITAISPVKKGKCSLFFDGMLVGFNLVQQRKVQVFHQKRLPVQLVDCEVKHSRYGDGFQVVLKSTSEIQESANPLDVHNVVFDKLCKELY